MTARLDELDPAELQLAELQLAELRLAQHPGDRFAPPGAHTPVRWAWRGAHPGAGTTTLASHLGGLDAGMGPAPEVATLVVCRSTVDGLSAAQRLAADELASIPTWHCLGLVVVRDRPAPPSRPVTELTTLVAGGYPAIWFIPWMETWQTDGAATGAPRRRVLHPLYHPLHLSLHRSLRSSLHQSDQATKEHP